MNAHTCMSCTQGRRQGVCLGGEKLPQCLATAARAIEFSAGPEKAAQRGGGGGGGGGGDSDTFFRLQFFFFNFFFFFFFHNKKKKNHKVATAPPATPWRRHCMYMLHKDYTHMNTNIASTVHKLLQ